MNIRNLIERARDSQFLIPMVLIAASLGLAYATNYLDEKAVSAPLLIPGTVEGSRTLLATIGAAIITAAALVFSFSAVSVQLAASQYSPRVVQEFLRDRMQQSIVGLVMGTFTYSLVSLATIGSAGSETEQADWTATTGLVLGVASALAIVAFIDHITRRVRIDDTIRRISQRTEKAFGAKQHKPTRDGESWNIHPETESTVARAAVSGFVQEIDIPQLVAHLPPGTIARLDVWTGDYVIEGARIVTMWSEDGSAVPHLISDAVSIGETRTINQEPGLGIRQLVDIALRALSPGINDPATAADVVRHLANCIRASFLAGNPARVFTTENGSRLVAPHAPTVGDQVTNAYRPIRRAAAQQPMVLKAIVVSLETLDDEFKDLGIDGSHLRREIEAASEAVAAYEAAESGGSP